jgi:hypothetical protein
MDRLRSLSRGGRLLLALAVGGAVFGIATAVQADIPDSGVIHGCYGKPGTPQKGQLRVRDASQGEQCRFYENSLDWSQTGPSGATGPTGPTGPAALADIWNADCDSGGCPITVDIAFKQAVVLSKTLPAGTFFVTAKTGVTSNTAGGIYTCYLIHSGIGIDAAHAGTAGAIQPQTLNLQHVLTLASPETVTLECQGNAVGGAVAFPSFSEIDAIPVGTVH